MDGRDKRSTGRVDGRVDGNDGRIDDSDGLVGAKALH